MTPPVAKISRPKVAGVIQRERLFLQLDEALHKPVIWISSPGGSGKTTLISSYLDSRKLPCIWYQVDERDADIATFFYYMGIAAKALTPKKSPLPLLTPEYLQNIPVFTRNYFEMLYNSMESVAGRRQLLIVFDNYQEAPDDSQLHDVMNHGLDIVPSWVRIVVVSRKSQPRQLVRQLANNRISNVSWEDLKFTRDEFRKMVKTGHRQATAEMIDDLYNRTDGWAAGLVLMMEQIRKGGGAKMESVQVTSDTIFDYFANEAFSSMESGTQTFLLQTSLLPKMTIPMAERLTGSNMAGDILNGLSRNNYFTQTHQQPVAVYQYHPLFREFLMSQTTEAFSADQIADLQRKAALLLEEDEQKEEAAELFYRARDSEAFVQFILRHAESLISQGRHAVLREWISRLPDEKLDAQPYLIFWMGHALMAANPLDTQNCFARSFGLFKERRERTGMLLSWTAVVNAALIVGKFAALDTWIPEIEDVLREDPTFPSPAIETMVVTSMFNALAARQPYHPDMSAYNDKALNIFMQKDLARTVYLGTGSHLIFYNLWTGNYPKATIVVKKLREMVHTSDVSDLFTIGAMRSAALYELFLGNKQACISAVENGLRVAAKTGVHVWDCHALDIAVSSALSDEDMDTALKLMEQFEARSNHARLFDKGFYNALLAWKYVIEGNLTSAIETQRFSVSEFDEIGFPYGQFQAHIMISDMLHEAGKKIESAQYLERSYALVHVTKSRFTEWMCLMYDAKMSLEDGNEDRTLECLRRGMALGSEGGFVNCIYWRKPVMTRLCIKALEAGIETDYVQKLIGKRNLVPEIPPLEIENWPWALKIYTLGDFRIEKDGKPLDLGAGSQRKPLDILKAVVAFGGNGVREEYLTDALWPDTDGDAAHSAFTTTLSRLRKLIGQDSIIIKGGLVSLNASVCWVDIAAFERLLENDKAGEKVFKLYQGNFLAKEPEVQHYYPMRERMKGKLLRFISEAGEYSQQEGLWKKAVELYLKGLEIDSLVEEFYQELMLCYREMGLKAEALSTYDRCHLALAEAFSTGPSFKTEDIYNDLKGG